MRISDSMTKAIFCNGNENYLLEFEKSNSQKAIQRNMPFLSNMEVVFIRWCDELNGFIIIANFDYDETLTIFSSDNFKFKVQIPHDTEPGILQMLDLSHEMQIEKQIIKLLNIIDD